MRPVARRFIVRPVTAYTDALSLGSVDTPLGAIGILCSDAGLVSLSLPGDEATWLSRTVPRYTGARCSVEKSDGSLVSRLSAELAAYFEGGLRLFTLPLDARGTLFQRSVWDAVCAVPFGETATYAEIARRIGRPEAPRAVGHANGSNRLPIVVPCHRLIGSNGALTGYAGGLQMKRWLIDHERRFTDTGTGH